MFKKVSKLVDSWKKFRSDGNVLVYQMGKVGSSSLEKSIPNSIHLHMLYETPPCFIHYEQRRKGIRRIYGLVEDLFKRIAIKRRSEVNIITLVRDPCDRNVSMFFQDLSYWVCHHIGKNRMSTRLDSADFLENVFFDSFDHQYVLTWFDKELLRFSGIDVFSIEFNKELGYQIISKGKFNVLILDSKRINELSSVISSFCGMDVKIVRENSSDNKWYGNLYKQFKSDYSSQLDEYNSGLKNSKYYRHFF